MRTRNALSFGVTLLLIAGCNSGGGSDRGASTAAPINSSTPGGVTSGTPGGIPGTNPYQLTDALVSSFTMDEVMHVDAATGQAGNHWAVGNGPIDVANWGNDVYVANTLSQDLTVVDRLANNVVTTIDLKPASGNTTITGLGFIDNLLVPVLGPVSRPLGVAVTPLGTKAFVANTIGLTAVNTTTNQVTKTMVGLGQINIANLISNPSTALNQFMASPFPGLGVAKVACTNDVAVATCLLTGKLMRVDARTDTVIDYIDVGRAPVGVAIARNKAYVACALSQETSVVDLITGQVITTIRGGMLPVDVAANQAEDKIYIANAFSGDISVVDTAADVIVDTLPAGLSISSILGQLGITLPATGGSSLTSLLNAFLQGFTGGMGNPSSLGSVIAGGSGSLLSPANLINGVLTGFLSYLGVSQQAINGLNLPAFGVWSVAVAHNPLFVCSANALMGDMAVTQTQTRSVNSLMGLTGFGPADVSTVWKR